MRWFWFVPAFFAVGGIAWGASEVVPVQDMAEGQALTGATLLNDSLYTNPASSAFTQAYSVDGAFFFAPRSFAVSVLDTKTSSIGGALGYFRKPSVIATQPDQGAKLGLSGRLSSVFGLGVAGKAVWGPNDAGVPDKTNDLDTGLIANLNPFQLGLTVRNVFGGNTSMAENREWSIGAQYNYKDTLFFDVASTSDWRVFKPYQYGIGVAYVSPWYFSLKGGYRFLPDLHLSYWSTGLSFISPRLSLHYSVQFPNQVAENIEQVIGATMLF